MEHELRGKRSRDTKHRPTTVVCDELLALCFELGFTRWLYQNAGQGAMECQQVSSTNHRRYLKKLGSVGGEAG